jgi:HK97 gp10 family phage protein
MATRSSLEGVAALTKQLIALGKLDDGKAMRAAITAGIGPAKKLAQAYIPVGTKPHRLRNGLLVAPGFARSQIATRVSLNPAKNVATARLGVLAPAFYAVKFVELGTRFQPPQPWLRRALADGREEGEAKLRESLRRSVEKAAKG